MAAWGCSTWCEYWSISGQAQILRNVESCGFNQDVIWWRETEKGFDLWWKSQAKSWANPEVLKHVFSVLRGCRIADSFVTCACKQNSIWAATTFFKEWFAFHHLPTKKNKARGKGSSISICAKLSTLRTKPLGRTCIHAYIERTRPAMNISRAEVATTMGFALPRSGLRLLQWFRWDVKPCGVLCVLFLPCLSFPILCVSCPYSVPFFCFALFLLSCELRRDDKRWQETRRDEKRWEEMRRDEKRWEEMRRDEKRWEEMRRDEKRWEEMRRDEKRWEEMRRDEKRREEMRLHASLASLSICFSCHSLFCSISAASPWIRRVQAKEKENWHQKGKTTLRKGARG